jgi:glycyl-tRNA synthetase
VLESEEGNAAMAKQANQRAKKLLKAAGKKGSRTELLELRPFTEATEEEITLIPSPETGTPGSLTAPRDFDLMFSTAVGAMEGATSTAYLRPETAQGTFVNFKNVMLSSRQKLPFGIAQIGKAFRNEITPRNYIFRSREFEQMEVEYFIPPPHKRDGSGAGETQTNHQSGGDSGEDKCTAWSAEDLAPALQMHADWVTRRKAWLEHIGIRADMLSEDVHTGDDLAHYASACTDICFQFPFGVQELEGVALRGDYDLRRHHEASGKSLLVEHEFTVDGGGGEDGTTYKDHVLPYVIEPSLGVDRCFLALVVSSFRVDQVHTTTCCPHLMPSPRHYLRGSSCTPLDPLGSPFLLPSFLSSPQVGKDKRTYLALPPRLAPIKVCVLPLVKNKPLIMEYAKELRSTLQQRLRHCGPVGWDVTGAIGRRYRRFDEIGTPFCVTVDFDSVEAEEGKESTVTLRLRDCMTQRRVTVNELVKLLEDEIY